MSSPCSGPTTQDTVLAREAGLLSLRDLKIPNWKKPPFLWGDHTGHGVRADTWFLLFKGDFPFFTFQRKMQREIFFFSWAVLGLSVLSHYPAASAQPFFFHFLGIITNSPEGQDGPVGRALAAKQQT